MEGSSHIAALLGVAKRLTTDTGEVVRAMPSSCVDGTSTSAKDTLHEQRWKILVRAILITPPHNRTKPQLEQLAKLQLRPETGLHYFQEHEIIRGEQVRMRDNSPDVSALHVWFYYQYHTHGHKYESACLSRPRAPHEL